ncbi:MAG: hypothetical protein K9M45_00980 [Kiritimatiellales bacterium]|nr:hypothetical protein [Kiritimatiellales bacterium]
MKLSKYQIMAVVLLVAGALRAQMAHEVLLLVNRISQDSMHVANFYASARGIPAHNVVYLDLPVSAYGGKAEVTWEEFTQLIWDPASKLVRERGLDQQILAWVYSVDFPIRVKTHPRDRHQMSVSGMTFLRNKAIPPGDVLEKGIYLSKLFGGPNAEFKMRLPALSLARYKYGLGSEATVPPELDYLKSGLRDRMPLPSMMLGYTGEKGNDKATVLKSLTLGRISDHRGQRSGIYFGVRADMVTDHEKGYRVREWQYPSAQQELAQWKVQATITTNFPAGTENVMGLITGGYDVDPSTIKSFAPGAMADTLTSWSAEFQQPQTKVTEWIKAGATVSAGSVVEPLSNPNKFPSARFFCHYAGGCTALESFYQPIASPLQLLLLGDPLAKPYALPIQVKVLGASKLTGDFSYMVQAASAAQNARYSYAFLLDGVKIRGFDEDPSMRIRLKDVSDGYHELTAIAKVENNVEFNAFALKGFVVARFDRSVAIVPEGGKGDNKMRHALQVTLGGIDKPERIRLICGERVLDDKPYEPEARLFFTERDIGEGPSRLQAVAVYGDGMEVHSSPANITVKFTEK